MLFKHAQSDVLNGGKFIRKNLQMDHFRHGKKIINKCHKRRRRILHVHTNGQLEDNLFLQTVHCT